ncbi:hypothetical protein, partial [Salinivirga cyanobacteriivorans]
CCFFSGLVCPDFGSGRSQVRTDEYNEELAKQSCHPDIKKVDRLRSAFFYGQKIEGIINRVTSKKITDCCFFSGLVCPDFGSGRSQEMQYLLFYMKPE